MLPLAQFYPNDIGLEDQLLVQGGRAQGQRSHQM
jgi:hypothetical protein